MAAYTVVFVVQGEGRGHLSQALAMKELMAEMDISIEAIFLGKSNQRKAIPEYFLKAFEGLITEFVSPNFLHDKDGKGIKVAESLLLSAINLPKYIVTSIKLVKQVNRLNSDFVINFYEPLIGLSQLFTSLRMPLVGIAHQYLSIHPKFDLPPKPAFDKNGLKTLSFISQIGSTLNLALSFYPFKDYPSRKIKVVPPLLRNRLSSLEVENEDFYLVYILNAGYAKDVIEFNMAYPNVKMECFWDDYSKPSPYQASSSLTFYHLSDVLFLEKLAKCKALITTAGFESVSEAIYLNKPVAMVPVKGHYEQKVNSYDALKANAGIRHDSFDLDFIIKSLEQIEHQKADELWVSSGKSAIKSILNELLNK